MRTGEVAFTKAETTPEAWAGFTSPMTLLRLKFPGEKPWSHDFQSMKEVNYLPGLKFNFPESFILAKFSQCNSLPLSKQFFYELTILQDGKKILNKQKLLTNPDISAGSCYLLTLIQASRISENVLGHGRV